MTDATSQVDRAIAEGNTHFGTISRIDVLDEDTAENFVTVDGRDYELSDAPPIWDWRQLAEFFADDTSYHVGQPVEVALDTDPTLNYAYDVSKYDGFSWLSALLGLGFMTGLIAMLRRLATRNVLLTDGARWQLWRTRRRTTVTVVEVRERRRPRPLQIAESVLNWWTDHEHQHHHLVIEANGRVFFWEAKSDSATEIAPGMTFDVIGKLRNRGWIVALTEPALYPVARLD